MLYIIKSGDTLSSIARNHNTTVAKLANDNNIQDPNKIYAGNLLVIPGSMAGFLDIWALIKRWLFGK